MKHNLELNDAVLITEESIDLIKKAKKECGLSVHSSILECISKNSPLKYFCFYQGEDEYSPTIVLVSLNWLNINVLTFEEFERKLFGEKITIYVPEGRTPVFTYKAKDGDVYELEKLIVDFVKKIDFDKITTGSIVKIKRTNSICWGDINFDEPVSVVFWKTPHFINSNGEVLKKGFHKSYTTFIQKGKFCLFSADNKLDFIEEVITY